MANLPTRSRANIGGFLARGDTVAIFLFAVIGLLSHHEGLSLAGIVRNAVPILLVWFLVAPFLRTYSAPSWRNLLYTWAVAVSAGVWLRFMVLGHPFGTGFFIFWMIALVFTLIPLLAWRLLARAMLRRRA